MKCAVVKIFPFSKSITDNIFFSFSLLWREERSRKGRECHGKDRKRHRTENQWRRCSVEQSYSVDKEVREQGTARDKKERERGTARDKEDRE